MDMVLPSKKKQLFLFLQYPIYLVAKWRNRLLSATANLRIGKTSISIEQLKNILENDNYSKIDHGLNKSDSDPRDRQNYKSALNLTSADLLNILNNDINSHGTLFYLQLLNLIIKAYVEKLTSIKARKFS